MQLVIFEFKLNNKDDDVYDYDEIWGVNSWRKLKSVEDFKKDHVFILKRSKPSQTPKSRMTKIRFNEFVDWDFKYIVVPD